ncbi:acetate--CoA ligase family protein [Ruegeria arenilitoris]|uniref:acetate--CoA ligase family protein n=1 Tax=Ruegeria arenilitoris TaxID=1173585 RepID=UPI00147F90A3|nr:acetate--CoA ligase family protein [Ruegeria arenilitoris]
MTPDLSRLLQPESIAVVGGGSWCEQVVTQSKRMGYQGSIWPVHPNAEQIAGHAAFSSLDELPAAPDAAFIGVNRHLTVDLIKTLATMDAGGAVCFASGFSEASAEDETGRSLQEQLIQAAGEMPILGPNCYGFINALDGALLWPDQHGASPVDKGVAILTQSSNIAINLTMHKRALPIAYMVTCGNMAQTSQAQIATALLDDSRVTAIGLHIEGFKDIREWEALASKAYQKGIPLIALKVGASEHAQSATVSHTASLAGSDAGAQALLNRLGIPRLSALPDFLETLKLLHVYGPLPGLNIAAISCSGGEASLVADMAIGTGLTFPPLSEDKSTRLRQALGPMVALNNPLDYHTYIWRDEGAMTKAWSGMTGEDIDLTIAIVDYPTTDPTDWVCTIKAALNTRAQTGARFVVAATLPELLPEDIAEELLAGGVVPMMGLRETLAATRAAGQIRPPSQVPVCLPGLTTATKTLTEAESKQTLAAIGLRVPQSRTVTNEDAISLAIQELDAPLAVKGVGLAHKSEHSAVRLNVQPEDVPKIALEIGTSEILIEEMIDGAVAELLIGVIRDSAHGFVLTLGAGGTLTELLRDSVSLLVPSSSEEVRSALGHLRIAPLLNGYRGQPAAQLQGILEAVEAVQSYVIKNAETLGEVEINPLLCTPEKAVAADALIRKA